MKQHKPLKGAEIETRARETLEGYLQDIPFLHYNIAPSNARTAVGDLSIELRLPLGTVNLLVEVKPNGQPANATIAAQQLTAAIKDNRSTIPQYGVFAAPYISPDGAKRCHEMGIGYFDFAGNCFLSFGQIYIRRENWPNPAKNNVSASIWAPKAQRILRVLMENPSVYWRTQTLAQEADVSVGLISEVRRELADREWINTTNEGFALREPMALLEEWAARYSLRRRETHQFYSIENLNDVESRLAIWCQQNERQLAMTGYSGAARIAPYARYTQVSAYVAGDIAQAADAIGLRIVESGANIQLIEPYDNGVFYGSRRYDDIPVACPTQVYLELCAVGGRGTDAAEFLKDTVLKPQWHSFDQKH